MESQRPFVSDRQNLLDALRRLYETHDALYFQNRDETLDFFLRVDPEDDDDEMTFELCAAFLNEPATPQYRKIVERATTASDDESLVYTSFSIDYDATHSSPEVEKAMEILNAHHAMTICPCNVYVIKDSCDMCIACHMKASASELDKVMCTICHQNTPRITMGTQPCCKQFIHPSCLSKWNRTSRDVSGDRPTCPMCRAASKFFSV